MTVPSVKVLDHTMCLHVNAKSHASFLAKKGHVTIAPPSESTDGDELWFGLLILSWTEFVSSLDSGACGLFLDSRIAGDNNIH